MRFDDTTKNSSQIPALSGLGGEHLVLPDCAWTLLAKRVNSTTAVVLTNSRTALPWLVNSLKLLLTMRTSWSSILIFDPGSDKSSMKSTLVTMQDP